MKIVLITTANVKSGRTAVLDRMLASITAAVAALPGHSLTLALLLQNCTQEQLARMQADLPPFVNASAVDRLIPLSVARNILLRGLLADGPFDADTLVAFPDDDCWYPDGLLAHIIDKFNRDADLDFWFCQYSSQPVAIAQLTQSGDKIPAMSDVVRNASSNTIFFRGSFGADLWHYDERLGVGTPLGSSEDVDFAIRAHATARRTLYCPQMLVGHRNKDFKMRAKYYRGALLVLALHRQLGAATEFRRKIAVGLYLVLRGELGAGSYLQSLRLAAETIKLRHLPG